jgi:hypothetical protein
MEETNALKEPMEEEIAETRSSLDEKEEESDDQEEEEWSYPCLVTSQDFIKFWGFFFAFVLLEMIGISQGFKTFESV